MPAVEEFDLAEAEASRDDEPPRRRRHRAWVWAAGAAALVAAGVVAAPPNGIPLGVIPQDQVAMIAVDASAPPREVWRVDTGTWHGGERNLWVVGGTVLAVGDTVQGIDLASGDVRWEHDVSTASCTVHDAVSCVVAAGTPDAVVVRITLDGSTMGTPAPGAVRAVDVGSDLIVLAASDSDQQLLRLRPDGTVVWTAPLPADVTSNDIPREWISMDVLGDRLYVGGGGVAMFDITDSSLVEDDPITAVFRGPYGYLLYRGYDGDGPPTTTLVDRDGSVRLSDIRMAPDDDPGSPVQISREVGTLVTRGDEVLWQDQQGYAIARVAGVLVLRQWEPDSDEERLSGHDLLTGEQLWERIGASQLVVGGGDAVLAWDVPQGGLAGIDVLTGEELWSLGMGFTPAASVLLPDGMILFDGGDIVRLGW